MTPSISDYIGRVPVSARQAIRAQGRRPSEVGGPGWVSVITIAFNSGKTIQKTIDSIAAQTYQNLEYIVVDGASTDGTVEILRSREDVIDAWISEPDAGISDAFNKGIALARGEYISLVNSDDWLEPTQLATAIAALRASGADFVYGNLMFHPAQPHKPYIWRGEAEYTKHIRHAMPDINHPTVVCRKEVYERHGLFDTRRSVAMDFEWLLRGHMQGVVGVYATGLTGHMSMDGVSHRHVLRGLREVRDISIDYGYPQTLAYLLYMIRAARTCIRSLLQDCLPRNLYNWLRHKYNPHYSSRDS